MKHGILFLGTFLFLASCVLSADDPRGIQVKAAADAGVAGYDPSRFHALVIGVNTYQHWDSLGCAANDAQAVADVLKQYYGYGDVRLILDEQATRKNILDALDGYLELGPEDSLLIYYAGHGWMDPRNQSGYWVPSEAPRDDKTAYLSNTQIAGEYFRKYKVRHMLVVSDSCFSGALLSRGGESGRKADWQLPAGYRKPSRWVLTSGDLAPVPDDAGTGHSPFATRLLQFLQYADSPAYGIQDLFVYIRKYLTGNPICQPLDTPAHMPGGEYAFFRLEKPVEGGVAPAVVVKSPLALIQPRKPMLISAGTPGQAMSVDLGNGVKMELVWIPPGECLMGSSKSERSFWRPAGYEVQHAVIISKGFWMGKYEVTQEQWEKVMGSNPSYNKGARNPVETVNWDDAQSFCGQLNKRFRLNALVGPDLVSGRGSARTQGQALQDSIFRLPTESEWEYACRAGMTTRFNTGDRDSDLNTAGWYSSNSGGLTHIVGSKAPNAFGLYDMHGNVWEWCQDWYGDSPEGSVTDPTGPSSGSVRVLRGGSWGYDARSCRAAYRGYYDPTGRLNFFGFRVVLSPATP